MTTILQENYNDQLEYVSNLKQLGVTEEVATYQARYNKNYIEKTIKEVIADLHLEQFATKQDILRLEKEMEKFATKEDLQILKLELKNEIKSDINETTVKIYQMKSELLRWQIGIAIVIMSANFALFKLMLHP
jgi:hypothetical protein